MVGYGTNFPMMGNALSTLHIIFKYSMDEILEGLPIVPTFSFFWYPSFHLEGICLLYKYIVLLFFRKINIVLLVKKIFIVVEFRI